MSDFVVPVFASIIFRSSASTLSSRLRIVFSVLDIDVALHSSSADFNSRRSALDTAGVSIKSAKAESRSEERTANLRSRMSERLITRNLSLEEWRKKPDVSLDEGRGTITEGEREQRCAREGLGGA
jgi:hypothetical protein